MSPLDCVGSVVVEYKYDAWGNHEAEVAEEEYAVLAEKNPFRYRGYYYDTETDLYYLQTRYYDPEVGRFLSQDDVSYLAPDSINGLNLYAYCGNNPVMATDPTGTFVLTSFLIGLGIAAAIGAVIGAASYVVSEVISFTITHTWTWSWGMFIGSIIGGAIGGALSFAIPQLGIMGSSAINGFLSNSIGMIFQNILGEEEHSAKEIFFESLEVAAIAAACAGITKQLKIPGFTGRGSISQVARQISTKFYNGTIGKITFKTFTKMVLYEAAYSLFSTIASGITDALDFPDYAYRHSYKAVFY